MRGGIAGRKLFSCLLMAMLIPISVLFGSETLILTLEKAKELALENNPGIKAAEKALIRSEAATKEALGNFLPTFSGFGQYQHAWELPTVVMNNPFNPQGGKIYFRMGTVNTLVGGFNFQQVLFAGGSIWNGFQIARLNVRIAMEKLKESKQEVLYQVTRAYYNLLFLESVQRVMEEGLAAAEENLEQVQKFYNVGNATRLDLLRAEVQVSNYRPGVLSAKNNVRLAKTSLRTLLGISEEREIVVQERLFYLHDPILDKDLEEIWQMALQTRPDLKMLNTQKRILKRQLSITRGKFLPSLVFNTNYQYQGQRDNLEFTGDDFFKSFNSGISLSVPLFSGLKNQARVQQVKASIMEIDYQKEVLQNGIRMEIESAYYNARQAEENVQSTQKIIEQAEEALRLAQLMFSQGSATQLDVLNAELALDQARMNYNQSIFDYYMAIAQLKKSLNQL